MGAAREEEQGRSAPMPLEGELRPQGLGSGQSRLPPHRIIEGVEGPFLKLHFVRERTNAPLVGVRVGLTSARGIQVACRWIEPHVRIKKTGEFRKPKDLIQEMVS